MTMTDEPMSLEQPDNSAADEESSPPEKEVAESAETVSAAEAADPAAPSTDGNGSQEEAPTQRVGMDWYVLRVASNREEQVRGTLERKVKIEGVDDRIGRILVPTLKEKRMKAGLAKVYERKLYPGYVFVEMATEDDGSISENVWFLVKETSGVGDFIGSEGKPIKMTEHDVVAMLAASEKAEEQPGLSGLNFCKGDLVKVTEGSFENFEGTIDLVDEHRGMVTVLLTIFGRSTPVEVEYWQLEKQ